MTEKDTSPAQLRQQRREGLRLSAAIDHYFSRRLDFAREAGVSEHGLKEHIRGERFIKDETLVHYGKVLGYEPPEAFAAWVGEGVTAPIFEEFEKRLRDQYPQIFDPSDDDPPTRGASRAAVPRSHGQLKVAGGRG